MINNRQNGRRRGRGGQRPGGGNPGRPESGNRIDSRARGNAGQLLEKYKALAADAQRQGDRVNTEYYLQFADHYFRVLAESRPREEQRRPEPAFDQFGDEDGDADEYGQEGEAGTPDQFGRTDTRRDDARVDGNRGEQRRDDRFRPDRQDARADRQDGRQGRPRFEDRPRDPQRGYGAVNGAAERPDAIVTGAPMGDEVLTQPEPATQEASTARAADGLSSDGAGTPAPRRRGRPPRIRPEAETEPAADAPAGFDADRLPPSLSVSASAEPDTTAEGESGAERPRRRRRLATPVEAGPAN